ncbi:hypothetical protein A8135_12405 [Legionella jamestowniensis]|uniref:Uncharacterized protein n=1 Tax=Legionella jamestowniensis TaxID=455 RepID=A0ABX2XUU0_9GAMM|nr:hypothetical protein A8135_12405 [Legionella jamestowniensis]
MLLSWSFLIKHSCTSFCIEDSFADALALLVEITGAASVADLSDEVFSIRTNMYFVLFAITTSVIIHNYIISSED